MPMSRLSYFAHSERRLARLSYFSRSGCVGQCRNGDRHTHGGVAQGVALGAWKIAVLVMCRSGLLTKMHDGLLTFLPVHSTFLVVGGWWLLGADTPMPMSRGSSFSGVFAILLWRLLPLTYFSWS